MRDKYGKARRKKIKELTKALNRRLRRLQSNLFSELSDLLIDLKTDSQGRIKFSQGNIKRGERVSLIIERFNRNNSKGIKDWIVKRFLDILNLNRLYFKSIDAKADDVRSKTEKLIMRRLGYDVDKKKVLHGTYIDNLVNNSQLAQALARNINRAISGSVPLKDFQQQVKGQLSSQKAFDIFQQVDRQASLLYAEELNLNYAIWNNSPKKTTTQFCRDRAGKVYSIEEINAWDSQAWKGKIQIGHRTLIDGHGYGCRTSIDFISDKLAFRLRPELKT